MAVAWTQSVAEFVELIHLEVIQLPDELGLARGPRHRLHPPTQPRLMSEIESKRKSWIKVLFYFLLNFNVSKC